MRSACTVIVASLVLLIASMTSAYQFYGWSVSSSPSDPCVNEGAFPVGGFVTLFLWYAYNTPDGMSSTDITVVVNPPDALNIFGFNVQNGFLNAGTATSLLLAIGGCPNGPIAAGNWPCSTAAPAWEFCLGGLNSTVNCDPIPVLWVNDHMGFTNGDAPTCCLRFLVCGIPCGPVSIEDASWGSIKSLYR